MTTQLSLHVDQQCYTAVPGKVNKPCDAHYLVSNVYSCFRSQYKYINYLLNVCSSVSLPCTKNTYYGFLTSA